MFCNRYHAQEFSLRMSVLCEVIFGALTPKVTTSFSNRDFVPFQNHLVNLKTFSSVSFRHRKWFVLISQPSSVKKTRGKYSGAECSTSSQCNASDALEGDFVVVNFYHFLYIKDPEAEVAKHLAFMEGLDLNGRIYLNEQGINAQLEGGISHLPLLDPSMRAMPLAPSEWRDRLEAMNRTGLTSKECADTNYILLDVRNGYEWDIGHFRGALRPNVDCFRTTSFGLSQEEVTASDPLANADKDKTNILMYCTGGIRCDIYSTILRKQGFRNLYTLKGGVSNYLKNEGPAEWVGNLFVFDSRLSLPPSSYYPGATIETDMFAKCYICGSQVSELRHRNCANLDCNLLFLCCRKCVDDVRGCCCWSCTKAPRIRPVLDGGQRYKKWHIYRDIDVQSKITT
ncbi:rhodanese-like domain-containing protein 8, chloroplastic isoform X2 [Prosopis cineraria]|uniref:rhodanese-like domain-containing protein 8, chloroplastic isoform X2 n=1 Tax=Prosopis cineraria TaxID=364024 RepID=UPI00240EFAE9|nr:rhodanese-like domain-containing protein 8, chloroplastic isoform X2 [Prosopis cineraria]